MVCALICSVRYGIFYRQVPNPVQSTELPTGRLPKLKRRQTDDQWKQGAPELNAANCVMAKAVKTHVILFIYLKFICKNFKQTFHDLRSIVNLTHFEMRL